jgi:signal transduction histidine kinase
MFTEDITTETLLAALPCTLRVVKADYQVFFVSHVTVDTLGEQEPGQRCFERLGLAAPCPGCPLLAGWRGPGVRRVEVAAEGGRTYEMMLAPLPDNGDKPFFIEMMRDVTDEVHLRRLMAQSARWQAMCQTAASVSHDFNNILQVIMGWTQLLLAKTADVEIQTDLQIIVQAAQNGVEMARRVRELGRPWGDSKRVEVDVNNLVQEVADLVEPRRRDLCHQKKIELEVTLKLTPVPRIRANPAEVRETLLNLALNALDAMPEGGYLSLQTAVQAERLQITVADTGVGMTEETQARIFQPFFSTKGEQGTGLGLSVTYDIVAAHKGTIRVESKVGQGTTFYVELPLAGQPAGERPE